MSNNNISRVVVLVDSSLAADPRLSHLSRALLSTSSTTNLTEPQIKLEIISIPKSQSVLKIRALSGQVGVAMFMNLADGRLDSASAGRAVLDTLEQFKLPFVGVTVPLEALQPKIVHWQVRSRSSPDFDLMWFCSLNLGDMCRHLSS